MKYLPLLLTMFVITCSHNNAEEFTIEYQSMQGNDDKYIVIYNANGACGTPPIDSTIYAYNDTVTVMFNSSLYKDGFYFIGFSMYADCSQPIFKPGYTFTITSSTMFYACFTNAPVYSITYYSNDSDGGYPPIDHNYYITGEKAYIKANTGNLWKAGYRFAGWWYQPHQSIYLPGQFITVEDANIELYAYFSPKPFTVTYHPNGANSGIAPYDNLYYDQGDTVTIAPNTGNLAIINKDGVSYCFDHWNDMPDGSGNTYYPGTQYAVNAALELYACYRPYSIGDVGPAGGIVFYSKDSYSDSWRYLEALPYDVLQTGIVWEEQLLAGQYRQTDATATDIGTGLQNTQTCIQVLGYGNYAAQLCDTLSAGNYNDWYLPSKDELSILYQNKAIVGNFTTYNYWSSSEATTSKAWYQNFNTGTQSTQYKNSTYRVRAIRQF